MNPPPPPPPPPSATTVLPSHHTNPLPSLSTALTTLTSLLHLSTTTLQSLPHITAGNTALLPCPFDPTHNIPPSSLFSHYLRCPSPLSISHSLRYPHTLHVPRSSAISFPDTSSDLFFSLENYFDRTTSANSFFYQNCPCPVLLFNNDRSIPPPPSLTLPRFLYLECSNFNNVQSGSKEVGFSVNSIRLLPSEIWAIQNEIEGWVAGEFPTAYSFRFIRAILRLQDCMLLRLRDWIVVNSPKYGVIVDLSMRDHMVWLVKLCLKAIIREAYVMAGFLFSDEDLKMESKVTLGLSDRRFECSVLLNVLTWLASQFSILYGEVNGKFFALDVLKECILESSLNASLFSLEGKDVESSDLDRIDGEVRQHEESSVYYRKRNKRECIEGQTVGNSVIFISQVAAAVAALHERSMVEGNIRASRDSRPLSAYQRNLEHAYVAKIADDERQKRPDYRPIIEHDGLLWQRSRNRDTKKVKTREELLAEERDYKRRRMSYRAKKLKRNAIEVMRDIIDEYMEEIKQAGGIDSMSNTVKEVEASASENSFRHESATGVSRSRRQYREKIEGSGGQSRDISKELESRYDADCFVDGVQLQRRDSSWHNDLRDSSRNAKRVGLDRDDNSRRLDGRQNSSHSLELMHYRDKVDYIEVFGEDSSTRANQSRMSLGRNSHKRERDEGEQNSHKKKRDQIWEFRDRGKHKNIDHRDREEDIDRHRDRGRSKTIRDHKDREEDVDGHGDRGRSKTDRDLRDRDENGGGLRNRWRNKIDRNNSSVSGIHNEFEDRYDPAKPSDVFDDEL